MGVNAGEVRMNRLSHKNWWVVGLVASSWKAGAGRSQSLAESWRFETAAQVPKRPCPATPLFNGKPDEQDGEPSLRRRKCRRRLDHNLPGHVRMQ